jgi:hypothetical protein
MQYANAHKYKGLSEILPYIYSSTRYIGVKNTNNFFSN